MYLVDPQPYHDCEEAFFLFNESCATCLSFSENIDYFYVTAFKLYIK